MRKAYRLGLLFGIFALYLAIAPFGYGAFALLQLFPPSDRVRRARGLQRVMRGHFRLMHDLLRWSRLLDFNARELRGEIPDGPAVLVCNHPGFLDITALMASIVDVTTAVKPSMFRRRWWRPLLEGARLFEGASSAHDSAHVVSAGVERVSEGLRVLIFPEGTRSPQNGLHRFGRTAFEIACRANVPVVPLVLAYEPVWLGKNMGVLALPERTPVLRVTALPAIRPADYGFSSRKIRDVVEAHLRSQLGVTGVQTAGHGHGNAGTISRIPSEEADRGGADLGGSQARGHRDGGSALRRRSGAGLH